MKKYKFLLLIFIFVLSTTFFACGASVLLNKNEAQPVEAEQTIETQSQSSSIISTDNLIDTSSPTTMVESQAFDGDQYTVTYYDNNGVFVYSNWGYTGSDYTVSSPSGIGWTVPTGYTFKYWTDQWGNIHYSGDTYNTSFTNNLNFTAYCEKNSYLITFQNWDGTSLQSSYVYYGNTPSAPSNPTRSSDANYIYTFAGWSPTITTVTCAKTYTATYTQTAKDASYSTTATSFTYNGGSQSLGYSQSNCDVTGDETGTNANTYYVYLTPKSGHAWSDGTTSQKTISWSISKFNFSNATIATISAVTYKGSAYTPTPAVTAHSTTLTSGTHFTYGYSNNTTAGQATVTITAVANTNYTGTKSVNFTINRATISTVPSQSGILTYNGSSLSPTWSNYDAVKMTLSGDTSGTNAGSYTATFTPTSNYKWSDSSTTAKSVNWTILQDQGSINYATTSLTKTYGDANFTNTLNKVGDGTVSYSSTDDTVATVNSSTGEVTIVGAGSATITATVENGTNYTYETNTASYELTVEQAPNPIAVTASQSWSATFSTSAQTKTITAATGAVGTVTYAINSQKNSSDATVSNFSISGTTLTMSASTAFGNYIVIIRANATGNANYANGSKDITMTITVNKANGSVTAPTAVQNLTYDGTEKTLINAGSSSTGTMMYSLSETTGFSEALPTATDADTYTIYYYAAASTNYNQSSTGSISATIAQRAITIIGASATKTYDGTALTSNSASLDLGTLVSGQTATYSASGSIIDVGTTANVPNVVIKSGATDVTANYNITKTNGTLEITAFNLLNATIADISAETYKGSVYTPTPAVTTTFETLASGTHFTYSYSNNINAGQATVKITAVADTNYTGTKSVNFTINPKSVSVSWTNLTFTYGGDAKTPTATATGVSWETLNITVAVSQKSGGTALTGGNAINVGTFVATANLNSVTGGQANTSNYTLTNTTTDFTINRATISAVPSQSGTLTYDGSLLSPNWNDYDPAKLTIGGITSGTNVGIYTANFTPKSNYMWPDNSTTSKNVDWTISQADGSINYGITIVNKMYGDENFTNTLTHTGDSTVAFSSSDDTVATVNSSTGEVTIIKAGTATITATVQNTAGYAYDIKTVSYTLNVSEAIGSIYYETTEVNRTYGDEKFTNTLTHTGDSTVAYSSNDSTVATVNSTTGEVTIVGAGTATITATVENTAGYAYATKTATYNIAVSKAIGAVTTAPTGVENLVYTGNALTLIYSGSGTGTMMYSLKETTGFSAELPSCTNAGNYTIYYYASENNNYTQSATANIKVKINKADSVIQNAPQGVANLVYDSNSHTLITEGLTSTGTMMYALNMPINFTTELPSCTNAGEYTIYYYVAGDSNHNNSEIMSLVVTISSAPTNSAAVTIVLAVVAVVGTAVVTLVCVSVNRTNKFKENTIDYLKNDTKK